VAKSNVKTIVCGLCHLALVAGSCVAHAGNTNTNGNSTSGSIAPSSGDAVKAGDIIFFRSSAPIFQPIPGLSTTSAGAQNADANAPSGAPADSTQSGPQGAPHATATPPASAQASASALAPASVPGPGPSGDGDVSPPSASASADSSQGQSAGTNERLCAPPRTGFQVSSISPASTTGSKKTNTATPANTQLVYGVFPSEPPLHKQWQNNSLPQATTAKTAAAVTGACAGFSLVQQGVPYQFEASDLDKVTTQRMGFTWGALVVPYKFYLSDKSIKGNPSTLLYAGYEGWAPGVSLAFVGSAGLGVSTGSSNATTTNGSTTSSTSSTSSNSTASTALYTLATGFIATFGGAMKAGVLFGWDYQASGTGFKYEGKTWAALSVGTSF
jgi:hypothetical protein